MGINLKEDQFNSSNKLVFLKVPVNGVDTFLNLGDGFSTRNENETLDEKEIQYINSDSKTKVLISKTFDYTFEGNIVSDDALNLCLARLGWDDKRNVKTELLTVFVNKNFYDETTKSFQATKMPVVLNSKSPTANAGEELALSVTMTQDGGAVLGWAKLNLEEETAEFTTGREAGEFEITTATTPVEPESSRVKIKEAY